MQAKDALQAAGAALASGKFNLMVLYEVNVAVAWKLLEREIY